MGSKKDDNELKVFITRRDTTCDECKENLGHHAWIALDRQRGALCLTCGDLDHLVFLMRGDAALTRRARKHSKLSAVVLEWSRTRKRYERQGLLVENEALEQAEAECLADEEARERRRAREVQRRAELDQAYLRQFAAAVREVFPNCPRGREKVISEHACLKYSGRVGRSAAAKSLEEPAIRLAVKAHVRHVETQYDELLGKGFDRRRARNRVDDEVNEILSQWER